jgi:hypothetical protein
MKRTHVNFVIDGAAFVAFLALMSTGLVLNFQLPPGSGGLHGMGTGHGANEREISLLWQSTRHEWGQIHLWIAWALIAILALHLLLHWNWIVCVVRGKRSEASGIRFGLGLASAVALVIAAAIPLIAPTSTATRGELQQQSGIVSDGTENAVTDIRGSMTFGEVADELNVTPQQLAQRLNLPDDTSPDEQIGRLLRRHGKRMSDLKQEMRDGQLP